jgi:hypothetical protein
MMTIIFSRLLFRAEIDPEADVPEGKFEETLRFNGNGYKRN